MDEPTLKECIERLVKLDEGDISYVLHRFHAFEADTSMVTDQEFARRLHSLITKKERED